MRATKLFNMFDKVPSAIWSSALVIVIVQVVSSHEGAHRICVPQSSYEACLNMSQQAKTIGVHIECVSARDRFECTEYLNDNEADFEIADPEDMYLASKLFADSNIAVVKEIRTVEEPEAEFRYEAVVVVHKNLPINSIHDLKGLRSCHTGVGRNVGYKIPITKLTGMGLLGPLSDTSKSARENELKALSEFFTKSCIVGTWSPDVDADRNLKKTYSNLCALCEHPDVCNYPDKYSGYEGALRCLTEGDGQVAFTKVIYVKKYFGLAYAGNQATESQFDPYEYMYLCENGTQVPITGPPCTWAARPWPGYLTSIQEVSHITELQKEISKLVGLGKDVHANWTTDVLGVGINKTVAVDTQPISPTKYLEKARYMDVIERDVVAPRRVVRLCVQTTVELTKCDALQKSAYSRSIRPSLACVKRDSLVECMKAVHKNLAEIIMLDPHQSILAEKNYGLKPLLTEKYKGTDNGYFVAAVKKDSEVKGLSGYKGYSVCLQENNRAGYFEAIKTLLSQKLIKKAICPHENALKEFFSAGVKTTADPMKCLSEGLGQIALVPYSVVHQSKDMALLCPNGERKTLEKVENCNFGTLPPNMVMGGGNLVQVQKDEIVHTLLSAASLYTEHPDYFLMFGDFFNKSNVIFSNLAIGLNPTKDIVPAYEEYKKTVQELITCAD